MTVLSLATLIATVVLAQAADLMPAPVIAVPWSQYFFQSFYHMSIIPILLMTVVFAWLARPSIQEEIPDGFKKFQVAYLSVWSICVAADWLQGPYVYALYSAYGFDGHDIAKLFVAGFGASLVGGCIIGAVSDRFGRKKMCLAYCAFYIASCCTKHFNNYHILMFGRITGGIATSMLFSCFECWMVSHHCSKQNFSSGLLSYMFGLMFTCMYCVAILAGLSAQFAADSFTFAPISEGSSFYMGGYTAPFDMAIICLIIGSILITFLWEENYGSVGRAGEGGVVENLSVAFKLIRSDKNMLLMAVVVSCFEGSMFAFVFNWTPALNSTAVPPPHGVIFALFMMACMCGSSVATLLGNSLKADVRLMATLCIAISSFVVMALAAGRESIATCFAAFLVFEFCCGLYFPAVGVMKSDVVPEHVRATMYNIYRVPLNAVVVGLLLSDISMIKVFMSCAALLGVALVSIIGIRGNTNLKSETTSIAGKQV